MFFKKLISPNLINRRHSISPSYWLRAESAAEVEAEYTGEEYTGDIPNARRISSGRQVNKPGRFTE